jgi:hypothetical protein
MRHVLIDRTSRIDAVDLWAISPAPSASRVLASDCSLGFRSCVCRMPGAVAIRSLAGLAGRQPKERRLIYAALSSRRLLQARKLRPTGLPLVYAVACQPLRYYFAHEIFLRSEASSPPSWTSDDSITCCERRRTSSRADSSVPGEQPLGIK